MSLMHMDDLALVLFFFVSIATLCRLLQGLVAEPFEVNCNALVGASFGPAAASRRGLVAPNATEPLVYPQGREDLVGIMTPMYNVPYSNRLESSNNDMQGNWIVLPDKTVHIRKASDKQSEFSLFTMEPIKYNPNRTEADRGVVCMGDHVAFAIADLPGYYVCMPTPSGGDMIIKNDGSKAVFRFRNKYTDSRTHSNQHGGLGTADIELMYLPPGEESGWGKRVEFMRGKTNIGTGLAAPSQHVYTNFRGLLT